MDEVFEFEGKTYEVGYGLEYIDSDKKKHYFNYGDFIELEYPEKKWFFEMGGSYQGEWATVGVDINGFYFHKGDYGSCSGCDWLEGLSDKEGSIEFLKAMKNIVNIGNNWEDAKKYLMKERETGWDDMKEAIDNIMEKVEEHLNPSDALEKEGEQ